jgi:HEPN domain-containing protein
MARQSGGRFAATERLCAGGARFREVVAFHCQQAAEKYLKAVLVRYQIEFPKTHDLIKLLEKVAAAGRSLADSLRFANVLTPYGVEVRYPSDAPEILAGAEVEAQNIARQVGEAVVRSLERFLAAEQVGRCCRSDADRLERLRLLSFPEAERAKCIKL